MDLKTSLSRELGQLDERHLLRQLRTLPQTGGKILLEGREYLNFSSNDYRDLANHPRVRAAAIRALGEYACGATASRLMCGHLPVHDAAEAALAELCGQESALLFASGYQANVGLMTSLARKVDAIFSDALNHASIIDGCRLSRAEVRVFPHGDMDALQKQLHETGAAGRSGEPRRRIIVSDAVFSMDGDLADVRALRRIADEHGAWLVIDEAHALGVLGEGRGLCAAAGVHADAVVGTLSKALGSQGGFVACSRELREYLVNHARSFIYSTGLAPACAAAAAEAARIVLETPGAGAELVAQAKTFAAALRARGLNVAEVEAPIIPVRVDSDALVMEYAARLYEERIIAVGIRPPTVPQGTARLRLSITSAHTDADLETAAARIADCLLGAAHAH